MQITERDVGVRGVTDEIWGRFTVLADAEGVTYAAMFARLLAHYGVKVANLPAPTHHARPGRRQVAQGGTRRRKLLGVPVATWRRFVAQAVLEGVKPAILFTRMVNQYDISRHLKISPEKA